MHCHFDQSRSAFSDHIAQMYRNLPMAGYFVPVNATWVHDLCIFSGIFINKTQESDKVRHNTTQTATVSIGLWTLISALTVREEGGL